MIATRLAGSGPAAVSLRRQLVGARAIPLRLSSSSVLLRLELIRRDSASLTISQCRFQGTIAKGQKPNPKGSKQKDEPPRLSVPQIFARNFLGAVRMVGHVFKSKTLKETYKTNPYMLILALMLLASSGVISIYVVYLYFFYFNGEHFTRYPEPIAAALRKALYFTNIDENPKRALKYYKQALELCDEMKLDPFSDDVIGIKLQISAWLQKIDNQVNAVRVLEDLLSELKRFMEVAEKAIKDGTVPPSLLPPGYYKQKEEETTGSKDDKSGSSEEPEQPMPRETIWGKRSRILQMAVKVGVKLGELYNDEHVLKPDLGHERLVWAVELSLKEGQRRKDEGTMPGEGEWFTPEELGAMVEGLAHSYEAKNMFELALPLFFQALKVSPDPCHNAVLMNNIAICFAQQNVVLPGAAAIDNVVIGKPGTLATPAERRAAYLAAAQRWATNAKQHAIEVKGEQRTRECDEACAVALSNLGDFASLAGKPAEARKLFEQAIVFSKGLGFAPAITQAEAGLEKLSKASS